jgi:hypothetical protein
MRKMLKTEFSRWYLVTWVTFLFAIPAWGQAKYKDRISESVDRGLAFLVTQQEADGAWLLRSAKHPAVTSIAVMAFLSAGHVPGEGPYQANVEKGIRWVLDQQKPSGLFCTESWEDMYQHGISTLMLCEVASMSDAKTARELKPKLEKAVKLILQAQRTERNLHRGGWRYKVDGVDADMSVTGWQILALRAARNLGCDVPAERIDLAMQYVLSCHDSKSGGFCYVSGSMVTTACTGTGVLALELCGKDRHHSREALRGGSYLLEHPPRLEAAGNVPYSAYYASQATFQLGGNYWVKYRKHLHDFLFAQQQQNGSWLLNDPNGAGYATAMSVLALTVEYRLLPIYQRDENAEVKKD